MNLTILLLSFLIRASLSWHPTGHFIAARIAEMELEKTHKELLGKLIGLLLFTKSQTLKEQGHPFVEAACFPDDIKYIGWKSFNQFHFYDNYIKGPGTTPEQMAKLRKSIVNMANSIGDSRETLKNLKFSKVDDRFGKAFQLRYMVHLVADAHQPLHSGSRVVNGKPDAGGNAFKLPGPHVNLHNLWDKTLGFFKDLRAPLDGKQWDTLNGYCVMLMEKYPRSKLAEHLKLKRVGEWITEAHKLQKEHAYEGVTENKEVPKEYLAKLEGVVEKQLVLGGYRLTDYIKDTFEGMDLEEVFAVHVKKDGKEEEDEVLDEREVAVSSDSDSEEVKAGKEAGKAAGKGTGLGLAVSRHLIEAMGGQLTAANHPDGGAVFTVRLLLP